MNYAEESLKKHKEWQGKIEVICRAPLETRDDLSLAYTPGVAQPCLEIQKDVDKSYELTRRSNLVAVVTDGTAVLGLGDIGPEAGMPVMEGKCALFKAFGDVDAVPLCVRSKEVDDIVNTVRLLAGSFGGVNLEDISAPRCFEIEKKLKECCDIPIFHDDQHGTAVVTLAAMLNALKVVGKKLDEIRVVTSGAGAAGIAIIKLLISMGLKDVVLCDRNGAIYKGRPEGMNPMKDEMAEITNQQMRKGSLEEVIKGADVFIGVSAPGCVTPEMVKSMADKPILFPMANPTPEIMPDLAKEAGAAVVGTGRSDFPNQINNVLAFPGIFRGALDVRASDINDAMKIAAAKAIASFVTDDKLSADYIIPSALDKTVAQAVAKAVAQAARDTGVARI
ncbi:malate dehydrogenase (oxaloacetate-decarboxylating) [Ruminococcus flavefaciens]|jgi:malate dehydrogenase (oxaloacetate-decarboxylating)|uniref:Malate dehydrogenase (Oxaloacetate-decarboxylating) n=1 Tax=Ruminococcus flavefaciens TaxID=1265 RepID=A0A1H6IV25_RUMFL|nr:MULTISPECIES: malic enzyme-like NAD(P)-binding protein [Ruminococcus]SEH50387.1 malate dehydrogenase (oxaloacetate-decarboxylating) [Ruminococcus flavefaciens]